MCGTRIDRGRDPFDVTPRHNRENQSVPGEFANCRQCRNGIIAQVDYLAGGAGLANPVERIVEPACSDDVPPAA